jgi:hypothetical protein
MNRRDFIINSAAAVMGSEKIWARTLDEAPAQTLTPGVDESLDGKPANLARFGEFQSWITPEATPAIQRGFSRGQSGEIPLAVAALAPNGAESDIGVEWPEFRTVNKVVARFSSPAKMPSRGEFFLELWDGTTALQGRWREIDFMVWGLSFQGLASEVNGTTWVFPFSDRKTCKIRLRFQGSKQVEIESFEVYGPSNWLAGQVHIEWGHAADKKLFDGNLEIYNGEILELRPLGSTQLSGPLGWRSSLSDKEMGGITVKLLGTSGESTDRTVLTLRTKSGDFSFLPAEALDGEPIDIPDFGAFVRSEKTPIERAEYRRRNSGKLRIVDAVAKLPEQTMAGAYGHMHVERVPLSFVGVDSNNHKFGIAPDGHIVVGNNDPSYGRPMVTNFAVYCDSTEASALMEEPAVQLDDLFKEGEEHHQGLEDGWLPIVTTSWSKNEVSFERTDFAALAAAAEPVDQSNLAGNELALLVSRLRIRSGSPLPKTISYFMKPWKPQNGSLDFGGIPANAHNAWEVTLDGNFVTVLEGDKPRSLICVDVQGAGKISLEPRVGAARYSLTLNAGETHTIYLMMSGQLLPAEERSKLVNVQYNRLHDATVKYWRDRVAEGMQVEIPDAHLQNIYNASLHHFLLAMTKDGKRGEYYPNTAVFAYGPIGSESTPILQSLEMRGLHKRSEECLKCWLSTQGEAMPDGDYASKEGGFYQFFTFYSVNQGGVLWSLAEHYLYTRDSSWLRTVAPQIVAGCDFIIRERKRTIKTLPGGRKPIWYGLAPAGSVFDMRDWEYTFMLNGWFYLGLKKSAKILMEVDAENARRIAAEAEDYKQAIRVALRESTAFSPVTRLRDNTSVPSIPPFPGIRGFRTELKDIPDVGYGQGYIYDVEGGPLHLLKTEVLEPNDPETSWMLAYLEDRFFTYSPTPCRVRLDELSNDWFNLAGFPKLQPYYLHYQDAYLQRDEISNFLRGFFNTLAATSDPQTFTFEESVSGDGGQPNKTHEEGWFFLQFRSMLVMEMGDDLFLARGTPREWLEDGKRISVQRAPSYFGEHGFRIESLANQGRIEATVHLPHRQRPANVYLRLRHPNKSVLKRVTMGGRPWTDFDTAKEWIRLPAQEGELRIVAYYL